MGIGATNRIINPQADIDAQVRAFDRLKSVKAQKKRQFVKTHFGGFMKCTKCDKAMRFDIGKTQIENKRENAPICIACIMEIPRKT